jgi:hypothetical protein
MVGSLSFLSCKWNITTTNTRYLSSKDSYGFNGDYRGLINKKQGC